MKVPFEQRICIRCKQPIEASVRLFSYEHDHACTLVGNKEASMVVHVACKWCGQEKDLAVVKQDYDRWQKREAPIQYLMPYVPKEDRELLISGMCGPCWEKYIKTEDQE